MRARDAGRVLLLMALAALAGAAVFACGGDDDDASAAPDDDADDDGDDDRADDDTTDDDAGDDDTDTPPPGCDTLADGWNDRFMVGGRERAFFLDLPDGVEESWPWPVVFSFHGTGDTAANWRTVFTRHDSVNNPVMPFIAVTPEHSGSSVFGWDVVNGEEPNDEAMLFDALIEELDRCWGVDRDRIYAMGHSFGGSVADLLGVLRGDRIASLATHSGVYASNPENGLVSVLGTWPPLTTENRYAQLLVHGSQAEDIVMILNFHDFNLNDRAYLNALGHDVVICNHGGAHNDWPASFDIEQYIEFFAAHPLGTVDSPFADGLPADYPAYCAFSPGS